MGWNELKMAQRHPLLEGIPDGAHAYFVHWFQLKPALPEDLIATTDYGGPLTAMVGNENIAGTQFHPEKSQATGIKLLENFLELAAMIIFPAIDLKDGVCVRLKNGVMADATVFNADPARAGARLCGAGFSMAALRRSQRRLCGPQRQCRRDQIHPRRDRPADPVGRRHPRHGGGRRLAGGRHHARDPGHGRPDRSGIS